MYKFCTENNINAANGLITVKGRDATKLLQGQLTVDVTKLTQHQWQLGAMCNPQGRVICIFRISAMDGGFYLLLPCDMVSIVINTLKKYAPFYQVEINEEIGQTKAKEEDIQAGIPGIYPATSARYLPHELNLYDLGAISLDKGCYTGQEIIARIFYRGQPKSRLYKVVIASQHLTPGQDIYAADNEEIVGSIVDYCVSGYNECIALIVTDETHAKRFKNYTRAT